MAALFYNEQSRDCQLHLKFRTLPPEVEERVRSTDADRLLEWSDRRMLTAERLLDVFGDLGSAARQLCSAMRARRAWT